MRILFILTLFTLISLSGFSQSRYFEGGVIGGLTASQVDGDTYSGFNKLGFMAGGYAKRMFSYTIGGQMEIRYIMKGAYASDNENDAFYYKLVLHYVDIPLMFQYHYKENVIFDLGVSPELIVYNREEDQYGPTPEDSPEFYRLTLSALGGVGYKFWDVITVNFRYGYSVIPIREHASGQTWLLNRGQYNNVLMFGIYYQISR